MALNQALVGKSYAQAEPFDVTAAGVRAYVDATEAGDIAAYSGDDAIAPPMFGFCFAFGALTAPVLDGELGVELMRLVHGEQHMRFDRPVRPGDVIRATSRIDRIEDKSSGEVLDIAVECRNQHDERVLEMQSRIFIKKSRRKSDQEEDREHAPAAAPTPFEALPRRFVATQAIEPDQSRRYAAASGDHNPIHTDEDVAKMAGLPGVILHGMCTMAFVHNALVRGLGGDPQKIASLSVRFSRPVLLDDTLSIDVRGPAAGPLAIEVQTQDGVLVLTHGHAELLP